MIFHDVQNSSDYFLHTRPNRTAGYTSYILFIMAYVLILDTGYSYLF